MYVHYSPLSPHPFIHQEAVKREVLEESGFEFEPEALIAVQRMDRKRVRFGVAGRIIGGSLKTVADAESVQGSRLTRNSSPKSSSCVMIVLYRSSMWLGSGLLIDRILDCL